jgi:hypothetical protein
MEQVSLSSPIKTKAYFVPKTLLYSYLEFQMMGKVHRLNDSEGFLSPVDEYAVFLAEPKMSATYPFS